MILKLIASFISLALFAGALSPSWADTVKIPVGQQTGSEQDMPRMGMKKDQVERQYGSPQGRKAAVGDPPISRWDYEDYSVYFEGNTVLHSVQAPKRRGGKSE